MKLKLFFSNLFNQMESKASARPQISLWFSSLYLGVVSFISKGVIYQLPTLPSLLFCPLFMAGHISLFPTDG